ncbi:MAG: glycosyltransferase family 2 protein [Chitinophagaceae bacterium]|nr:glycosyltransferase family 2 protein [Chitinophagaceae bacterium]
MLIPVILFWVSLSILFFCYIGYGLLLFLFNKTMSLLRRSPNVVMETPWMPVTLIITAYNEGEVLKRKIENTLAIDYPREKLKVIFVTDGSTDGSEKIISQQSTFTVLHQAERLGKMAAIKRAMAQVQTPIVVFSDANTELNTECIKKIASHYTNPRTGGVAGEKKIISDPNTSAVGEAEGLYWKYESFMKKQDAAFNTVVGAAGELFSIRSSLFVPLPDRIILDDFVISMKVCLQGFRIEYEPEAFATEFPSASLNDEARRKVRISAGAYQCIGYLKQALNIFHHPLLSFQYISRRVLRWVFCPLMLIVLLFSNIIIASNDSSALFKLFMFAQVVFYMLAFFGWRIIASGSRAGILTIPFYFVFMNYCLVRGCIRFLKGKHTVLWEKSSRDAAH